MAGGISGPVPAQDLARRLPTGSRRAAILRHRLRHLRPFARAGRRASSPVIATRSATRRSKRTFSWRRSASTCSSPSAASSSPTRRSRRTRIRSAAAFSRPISAGAFMRIEPPYIILLLATWAFVSLTGYVPDGVAPFRRRARFAQRQPARQPVLPARPDLGHVPAAVSARLVAGGRGPVLCPRAAAVLAVDAHDRRASAGDDGGGVLCRRRRAFDPRFADARAGPRRVFAARTISISSGSASCSPISAPRSPSGSRRGRPPSLRRSGG